MKVLGPLCQTLATAAKDLQNVWQQLALGNDNPVADLAQLSDKQSNLSLEDQ